MVEIDTELQLLAHEPGLDESCLVFAAHRTKGCLQAHLLATALEPWRVKQVEIILSHLSESEDAVHGTKAGTNGEVTGILLIDPDDQVLAVGNVGRLGLGVHVLEEL